MAFIPQLPYDGFDDYSSSQIFRYWTGPVNFSGTGYAFQNKATINPTAGRCGTGALQVAGWGSVIPGCGPQLTFSPLSTGIFGFAFSVSTFQEKCHLIRFQSGGVEDSHNQIAIGVNTDGTIFAVSAADHFGSFLLGGTLLGTSVSAINENIFHYGTIDYTIDPTGGVINVYLDGSLTPFLTLTGINTDPLGLGSINSIQLGRVGATGGPPTTVITYDDFYALDKTGPSPLNDQLGDVHVEMRLPPTLGVGDEQDWNPVPGPNHSPMVNEPTPDDDVTYIEAETPGLTDTFPYLVLDETGGTIFGVLVKPCARKDDSGYKELEAVARIAGTDYVSATFGVPSLSSYRDFPLLYTLNPATGVAWTVADVNAAQFGPRVKT